MEALAAAILALIADAVKMGMDAQQAKDEDHAAILARVEASRAALAGAKSEAHKAVEDALKAAHDALAAALAART